MILHRFKPGMDLRDSIQALNKNGTVVCGIGSLEKATLRTADEKIKNIKGPLEIISLQGTLTDDGVHLHISVGDSDGKMIGGHLKRGCIIRTTAEVAIMPHTQKMLRLMDDKTGFKELFVLK